MTALATLVALAVAELDPIHNVDTERTVRAYCSAGPKTSWERYVCSRLDHAEPDCLPQRLFSRCTGTK